MFPCLRAAFRLACLKLLRLEEWNIGVIPLPPGGIEDLLASERLGRALWRAGVSRTAFLADPILWPLAPSPRVLLEEYDYWTGRGRIKSLSLEGLLGAERPASAISLAQHASYPFVFPSDGSWCCIPECAESRAVDLYVWDAGAGQWNLDARLLEDVRVIDPTLAPHEGNWYLFGTDADDGPSSKLRIWVAKSPQGPWAAHPMTPARVARDQVRPAGPLFRAGGHLYRPSQDCRRGYGSGIILNRIDRLSPTEYLETPVREWRPDEESPYGEGMHTISFSATHAIIDGKRARYTPLAAFWKAWWKVTRALRWAAQTCRAAKHTDPIPGGASRCSPNP